MDANCNGRLECDGYWMDEIVEVRNQWPHGTWSREKITGFRSQTEWGKTREWVKFVGSAIMLGGDGIRHFVGPLPEYEMRRYQ